MGGQAVAQRALEPPRHPPSPAPCLQDFYTGKPRGIAFIEYTTSRDADDAVRGLDRTLISGREIQATYAQQGRKRPEDFRKYGGGQRGGAWIVVYLYFTHSMVTPHVAATCLTLPVTASVLYPALLCSTAVCNVLWRTAYAC